MNVIGEPIDERGDISKNLKKPIETYSFLLRLDMKLFLCLSCIELLMEIHNNLQAICFSL